MNIKGPALRTFADHYGPSPIPGSIYQRWRTSNLQIITGTQHAGSLSIAVVDLDGDEAPKEWATLCARHDYRPKSAWISRTGSGGTHLYYSLPDDMARCPSGMLWGVWDAVAGRWEKHKEIRLLADRALVIAPPSLHVKTGRRYTFLPGLGPNEIDRPEIIPQWVLDMPRLSAPRPAPPQKVASPGRPLGGSRNSRHDRKYVLTCVPDKIALARSWGLRTASQSPNAAGWVSCYVPWRESLEHGSRPSGSMQAESGTFQDRMSMETISFFELASRLQPGSFPSWIDCMNWCAARYA